MRRSNVSAQPSTGQRRRSVAARKVPVLLAMILALVATPGTAGAALPAAAGGPAFILTGMDVANLDFSTEFEYSAESWTVEVFVGYVYADFLRYADGTIVRPHTDTDIRVCAYLAGEWCGSPSTVEMSGGTGLLGSTAATMVSLTSATLDEITVSVSDGVDTALVTVDLEWTAYGKPYHETEPHRMSQSKIRDATITGTVSITGADESHPLSALNGEPLNMAEVSLIRSNMSHGIAMVFDALRVPAARTVGERISLFDGDTSFPAGEPFYISHGFAGFTGPDPFRWDFILEVDGVPVPDSGVVIEQREDELKLGGGRVYNFPDGMTGTHTFDGYWYQSCKGSLAECEPGAPPGSLTEVFHLTIEVIFDES
jgi:hypothetical protein